MWTEYRRAYLRESRHSGQLDEDLLAAAAVAGNLLRRRKLIKKYDSRSINPHLKRTEKNWYEHGAFAMNYLRQSLNKN
jgi:hypothetical protein